MKKYARPLLSWFAALACLAGNLFSQVDPYTQRFIDLRAKIVNPANGYFSTEGVPFHSVETLMVEAPDHGHETTSEALSYWVWLEVMNGRITGNWAPLNNAWTKLETLAIPTADLQPTASSYNPGAPATYAAEHPLPSQYPSPLETGVPVGQDPVSPDLTAAYGSSVYGMHWLFDCDNFYGYGNKGDGVSRPSYINTFQRGPQESTWETIPQPCWESFRWGSLDGSGYLKLFITDTSTPTAQWKYTDAPDADARAVQAIYWAVQFARDQGLNPAGVLPVAKASKMGDFSRLAMFDKYFRPIGVQNKTGPGGVGYSSAHYLISWYYAWGGPLVNQNWAWRIGSSHMHFGYQNPVAAFALSATADLRPVSANGARDWGQSLIRQLEFYQWLQSAEGAIAGGATNSFDGDYRAYPAGTPTFYNMAYQENPVYLDPGSNTWFGFQAWSMERVAEYYYITNDPRAKVVIDKWIAWAKTVIHLLPDGTFELPSEIGWSGTPNTWVPTAPVPNTGLHVNVVTFGKDLGVAAATAKTLTYYAAATQRYATLDTASRDLAKEILDRMWTNYFEPTGKGVAVVESRSDFHRFFDQDVFVPTGWSGRMPNGDPIVPGIKFIDIRTKYMADPDWPALVQAVSTGVPFQKAYHRFWAQADIALANAEYGRFFGAPATGNTLTVAPTSLAFTTAAGSSPVTVTANVAWTATDDQTWISVAPVSGTNNGTVTVSVLANTGAARTGTVTITGGGLTRTVAVTQAGVAANLTVAPATLSFTAAAGSSPVTVTSNVAWTATDDQTWITVAPAAGANNATLTVSVLANTGAARTGTVTVTGGGITRTVAVSQAAGVVNTLTVAPTSLSFTTAAGSSPVTVTSNVAWTATDDQTWITVTPASGANNATLTVSVLANTGAARTGTVTVTGGGITQTVAVSQAGVGATLTVAPAALSFTAAASSSPVTVTSNVAWTATDDQTWITVTPASGANNATLTVSVLVNTGAARTGTVTVTGGGITRTVAVTQAAGVTNTLTVAPASLTFTAAAGSSTFAITSNVSWTVTDDQTWITATPASGANNATITVAVLANTLATSRTGTITVTGGGITRTISVTQAGVATGTPCANPVAITLPFAQNGAGDFCFVTSGTINFINSWNMQLLEINGVNFTGQWKAGADLPPRINGNYYIHYVGNFPWSHFEASGSP